jgi:tetratricopeptide (TPR) repeat protein
LTPLLALQQYYEFAYRHLALAGNRQPVAAEALFSLGRCEMLLEQQQDGPKPRTPKSIAFFQAALMVDATHTRAANELGVLLARKGRWEEAHEVLAHATRRAPTPVAFHNLQKVKQHLGLPLDTAPPVELIAANGNATIPGSAQNPLLDRTLWVDRETFQRWSEPTMAAGSDPHGETALHPIPMPSSSTPDQPTGPVHVATRPGQGGSWFGF